MINNKEYNVSFTHTPTNGRAGKIYLPESTLYHSSKTSGAVLDDLRAYCRAESVSISRAISVDLTKWSAEWGTPI